MPHPIGGYGNNFNPGHSFDQAYTFVGQGGVEFTSTTGETINAHQGMAQDGVTRTIVFIGENSRHGNVCPACWGYRRNCSQTRIGQCTEALDSIIR